MSARWEGEEALLQPITPEQPCGDNLEDTELLASFDSYRVFGQSRSLDAIEEKGEKGEKGPPPPPPPDWAAIRARSVEALAKSKDLRLLAHLAAALLRTDGVPAFAATLNVAMQWLETYWAQVYPLVDEDAILRRNALNNFADPMAMIDRLRRVPLGKNRQHGRVSPPPLDNATPPPPPRGKGNPR